MSLWKSLKNSLLSKDDGTKNSRLNTLIKNLKKERFEKYITHDYLPLIFKLPAKFENGEIIENFLIDLLKEKLKTKDRLVSGIEDSNVIIALEIGSFQGLGAKYMVQIFESLGFDPKVHCVDLMFNYYEEISKFNYSIQGIHLLENTESERRKNKIFLHSGRSSEVLPFLNLKADFVYVDGEHTSGGVYLDLVMSLNQVDNFGIIVIDDVDWIKEHKNSTMPGIKLFLKEYGMKGLGVIDSMYSLSKNSDDTSYFLYEDKGDNIYKMKTKQLILLVKHFENSVTKEDVLEKGLYFS